VAKKQTSGSPFDRGSEGCYRTFGGRGQCLGNDRYGRPIEEPAIDIVTAKVPKIMIHNKKGHTNNG
jgi:hypothetical protein